jgi:hypothetical protein
MEARCLGMAEFKGLGVSLTEGGSKWEKLKVMARKRWQRAKLAPFKPR